VHNKPADADVIVQDVDEVDDGKAQNPPPENNKIVNLAESSNEPSVTVYDASGRVLPTFVTPRTGLHIKVEEDET
jgi:hypothetical protein